MAQTITVPGHGDVDFPDDMSDEQISAAIRANMSAQPVAAPEMGQLESAGRAFAQHLPNAALGVGQLGANIIGGDIAAQNNAYMANRESDYQAQVPDNVGSYLGAIGGEIAGNAPLFGAGLISKAQALSKALPWASKLGQATKTATLASVIPTVTAPVTGGDYGSQKATQMAVGIPLAAAMPGVAAGGGKALNWAGGQIADVVAAFAPNSGGSARIARDVIEKALEGASESEKAAVIAALNQGGETFIPGQSPTVGQILAGVRQKTGQTIGGGLVKLEDDIARSGGSVGSDLRNNTAAQEMAMRRGLEWQAGGTGRQAQKDLQKSMAASRTAETKPMIDNALQRANIGNEVIPDMNAELSRLTQAERAALEKQYALKIEQGIPSVGNIWPQEEIKALGKRADELFGAQKDMQAGLDWLKQNGMKEMRGGNLIYKLQEAASKPGATTLEKDLASKFIDRIRSVANKDGTVDARDIATARSEVELDIGKLMSGNEAWNKSKTAGTAAEFKRMMDNVIEDAGGKGWKEALDLYAQRSRQIDQRRLSQGLLDKLVGENGKLTPADFLNTTGRGEEDFLSQMVGSRVATPLRERLGAEGAQLTDSIRNQLLRNEQAKSIVSEVGGGAMSGASKEIPRIPFGLNPKAALINALTSRVGGGAVTPTAMEISKILRSPNMLANIIGGRAADGAELGAPLFMKQAANAATGNRAQQAALIATLRSNQ